MKKLIIAGAILIVLLWSVTPAMATRGGGNNGNGYGNTGPGNQGNDKPNGNAGGPRCEKPERPERPERPEEPDNEPDPEPKDRDKVTPNDSDGGRCNRNLRDWEETYECQEYLEGVIG